MFICPLICFRFKASARKAGFTLIELLVVIAIIAILAAILFPVFAQARDKARQTSCLNNEKQMAIAILAYAQDADETFPLNVSEVPGMSYWYDLSWMSNVQPYVKNNAIFVCPSAKYFNGDVEATPEPKDSGLLTSYTVRRIPGGPMLNYGMTSRAYFIKNDPYKYPNEYDGKTALYDGVAGYGAAPGLKSCGGANYAVGSLTLADVKRPADMTLVLESNQWDNGGCRGLVSYIRARHTRSAPVTDVALGTAGAAPAGIANIAFTDGHVKGMSAQQMYPIVTDSDGVSYYRYFYGKR